jgi:hypothetical protein
MSDVSNEGTAATVEGVQVSLQSVYLKDCSRTQQPNLGAEVPAQHEHGGG